MVRAYLCGFALLVTATSLLADELRTLGGKTIAGTLSAISGSEVTLTNDAGTVATPLAQVLAVELRAVKELPPSVKYTDVRLLDDSTLHCKAVAWKGNDVELTLISGASVKVPLNYISWLVQDAHNPALRKKFDDMLAQKSKRDRIVVLREGELNALEGTLGDIDAKGLNIQFRRDGADAIGVLLTRLHGLIFYRTQLAAETPLCHVHDIDGNTLSAVRLAYGDDKQLVITTGFGETVSLRREVLARLDFNNGKLTYLSDLEPTKVIERSGIGLVTPYRKDMNLDGEPILLDKQYAKGLSLHAHTELSYNLGGKYKEFKARLGADGRTGTETQALVTIYCDGEKVFNETVSVQTQKEVALNVKDVQVLRIVVSSRNLLDLHDHATLADARVSQ